MGYKAFDLHCDSVDSLIEGKDLRQAVPGVHVDLPRLRKGNVGLQVFAAYVPPGTDTDKAFAYAKERLDAIETFAKSDESLTLVETAGDLRASMALGRTGVMKAVENALAIENSLEKLEKLRREKVRIMTLVHSQHMSWVASCTGTAGFDGPGKSISGTGDGRGGGLGSFGEQVVDAMNDLGIIPDVSHSSESAFWDIIGRSKKPVIASHSCAWNFCAAARNLKDDQLKALGDTGGVVGVNFYSAFLSEAFRLSLEKDRGTTAPENPSVKVPSSIIADHIEYMVKMAGEDSVALGSDFDGIEATPEGISGCDYFPVLEKELTARGFSDKRIEKIFNLNFLRVLEQWE